MGWRDLGGAAGAGPVHPAERAVFPVYHAASVGAGGRRKRDRRLKWAAVPGLVFAALNIAVGLRSYGLMDLFRQGMDLFCQ